MSTIVQQGSFTSTGEAQTIPLVSGVDWMEVINATQAAATQTPGRGVEFFWQYGLNTGEGFMKAKLDGVDTVGQEFLTTGGFSLFDSSNLQPGPLNATGTAITAANPAEVAATSTAGLSNGDVVRMIDTTGMKQIAGAEFTISGLVANTSFELAYLDASGFAAPGTTCSFRRIPFDLQFSPRERTVTSISQEAQALVQLSVTHNYRVGDLVRLNVPAEFGMVEANGKLVKVLDNAVAGNKIRVDLDTTAFTAFAFPASGPTGFTFAQVVPVGTVGPGSESATRNTSLLGMQLLPGVDGPAGSLGDVIYWRAGKSVAVSN